MARATTTLDLGLLRGDINECLELLSETEPDLDECKKILFEISELLHELYTLGYEIT